MREGDRSDFLPAAQGVEVRAAELVDSRGFGGGAGLLESTEGGLVLGPAKPEGGVGRGKSFGQIPLESRGGQRRAEPTVLGQFVEDGPGNSVLIPLAGALREPCPQPLLRITPADGTIRRPDKIMAGEERWRSTGDA
jgi:hypothetical protein